MEVKEKKSLDGPSGAGEQSKRVRFLDREIGQGKGNKTFAKGEVMSAKDKQKA
ncbi:MAG: hypothetical protein LBI61_03755 [Puniceicoccales bacterium]|jgi:hypothetical protein|nr:hypothetical protein [Puniceicoccales bacterium]